jgi:hypothetical protein
MSDSAALYTVTLDQLAEISRIARDITYLLGRPSGSPIDPDAALAALHQLMPPTGELVRFGITDYATEEFLSLVLPETTLNRPIEKLGLPVRAYNICKREGIDTLGQLLDYAEADLLELYNFAGKSLDEVNQALARQPEVGLHLSRHERHLEPPAGDKWAQVVFLRQTKSRNTRAVLASRLPSLRIACLATNSAARHASQRLVALGIVYVHQLTGLTKDDLLSLDWGAWRHQQQDQVNDAAAALAAVKSMLGAYELSLHTSSDT